jgi:fatty-acyl-CoA synthase
MQATMMDHPLSTQMIFERGERLFSQSSITSFDGADIISASFAKTATRARRLAAALNSLGLGVGERLGTYCWNTPHHLEAYLAVPAMGAVLHTLNVRLPEDQLEYVINHADDRVLLVDAVLMPNLVPILHRLGGVGHLVIHGEWAGGVAGFAGVVHDYERLIAAFEPITEWPRIVETDAAVMCYTSGTTGMPKGVVYSHRSIFLHSLASMTADAFAIANRDRILMVPPMFHANAWGMPFSGWLAGSDMILPAQHVQPDRLARAIKLTRPTLMAAVPTILNDLLQAHAKSPIDLSCFRAIISGGSAVSPALIERVKAAWGVDVMQGWGMTETSPMCVLSLPPRDADGETALRFRAKSGRPVAGMEVRIVDEHGARLPDDGVAIGHLELRGPWVAAGYYLQQPEDSPLTGDGWLRTGDVGTIDNQGYVQVTDRIKDLIKSGGEWISSVDLENEIIRIPNIAEVAVVAVPDARWEERPLAVIVMAEGNVPDYRAMRSILLEKFAKFMVPESWALVTAIPKTSVGKMDKKIIREQVNSGALAVVVETEFAPGDRD